MNKKSFFISGLCLVLALGVARAQTPNASRQVDSVQQRRQLESVATNAVPEFYEGETGDVGPQSVLQAKHRRTFIEASADEQYFFSDNVFLANQGKQGADVLVSTVQAALAPTPYEFAGGLLAPRLGYQHQWFNYNLAGSETVQTFPSGTSANLNIFDFNVSTIFSDATWRRNNWTFTLGGDYRRLLDSGNYDEFYREFVPRWSVGREFSFSESTSLSVTYEGNYRFTKSAPPTASGYPNTFNDRTDQGFVLAGNWRLCSHAILQPFYRFQFAHYTRINREDYLNSFGLTLYCPITDQINIRTFAGYDIGRTDGLYAQNYQAFNAGVGLNLTVRF